MTIFVSRTEWGSRYGTAGSYMGQVSDVADHHTPGQDSKGMYSSAVVEVRSIERGHVEANGWSAIGYTWLVSGPYAFEGRGWARSGAHAPGGNTTSVGIAFILDGRYRAPTDEEWRTAAGVIRQGVALGHISPEWTAWGHRDYVATTCPGDLVYSGVNDKLHYFYNSNPITPPGDDSMTPEQFDYFRRKLDFVQGLAETSIRESREREGWILGQGQAILAAVAQLEDLTDSRINLETALLKPDTLVAAEARTDEMLSLSLPPVELYVPVGCGPVGEDAI